jgi:hypothetical protein
LFYCPKNLRKQHNSNPIKVNKTSEPTFLKSKEGLKSKTFKRGRYDGTQLDATLQARKL